MNINTLNSTQHNDQLYPNLYQSRYISTTLNIMQSMEESVIWLFWFTIIYYCSIYSNEKIFSKSYNGRLGYKIFKCMAFSHAFFSNIFFGNINMNVYVYVYMQMFTNIDPELFLIKSKWKREFSEFSQTILIICINNARRSKIQKNGSSFGFSVLEELKSVFF